MTYLRDGSLISIGDIHNIIKVNSEVSSVFSVHAGVVLITHYRTL
jgi:Fe-S cluster assembly ATPase SufC